MARKRFLLVVADDFGIGPDTSQGILDLAAQGVVSATVLLANSPHAEFCCRSWRYAGKPVEVGWHPCLTLDGPVLPPAQVSSLVDAAGSFWSLGSFLQRLAWGSIKADEVEREWSAQLGRFIELTGQRPAIVNAHHHVNVFPPLGKILRRVLRDCRPLPYVRRVREPWHLIARVPGARPKRSLLSAFGWGESILQQRAGFPGNDVLAGITDPRWVSDPEFLARWLERTPGRVVELTVHPGYLDATLVGRDGTWEDGQLQRRVNEYNLLVQPRFRQAVREAHFTLVSPADLASQSHKGAAHAA